MDSHDVSAIASRTEADRAPAHRAPPTRCGSAARAPFRAACSRVPERSVSSHGLMCRLVIRTPRLRLYLRIDVEKGRETRFELLLDLVFTALERVHGDVRLTPILQFDWGLANRLDFIGRQQTQTVNQCQVCHSTIVSQRISARRCKPENDQSLLVESRASPPGHLRLDGRGARPSTTSLVMRPA